ncbi:hypothetical protein P1J04_26850 (plasmid) [Escherichia coli]|uniref:hypothetical protein n=1 Tax=Escherichia coli TaxID=562 RepID=UPI0027E515D2|nr:hypothetical protein [Escherichia coli]WMQ65921.1 hypothetical protein P1J04_26850 [Escherichia coli]
MRRTSIASRILTSPDEHDYWGSSGTGGYSDLKAHTTMLQVDAPYSDGRMFFRSDFVNMNVGSFSTECRWQMG